MIPNTIEINNVIEPVDFLTDRSGFFVAEEQSPAAICVRLSPDYEAHFVKLVAQAICETMRYQERGYYSTEELAALLGVSVQTIIRKRATIPGACKIGRQWRFDKNIIDSYIRRGLGKELLKMQRERKLIKSKIIKRKVVSNV